MVSWFLPKLIGDLSSAVFTQTSLSSILWLFLMLKMSLKETHITWKEFERKTMISRPPTKTPLDKHISGDYIVDTFFLGSNPLRSEARVWLGMCSAVFQDSIEGSPLNLSAQPISIA